MIVLVFLLSVRVLPRNARCPNDNSLLLDVIPEEFRSPDIHRCRIAHDLDETLFTPMHQVLRISISETSVSSPARRPHQMEHAVGGSDDAGVAHHFLMPNLRTKPNAVHLLPVPSVATIDKPQTVCSWFVERCGYIHFLLCRELPRKHQQKEKDT